MHIYGNIFQCNFTYFDISCYLYLVILRVYLEYAKYIYKYIHMLFLYEYYTFIFVLCFLILRRITNILYHLLSDFFLMSGRTTCTWSYQAHLVLLALRYLAILLTFEDIRVQRKQSGENTH